ncbi:response regulator transcription factor [Kibdelosporangium aridum]|uniref:DNA-binding response regulator, NarL/FixJ family, contains REC and HTH domains n=1 Tax=Kibdelosporangium aridum TaxID=2030 RepID=A0A1W2DCW0_KIBAR|nr:response regulator transcription factor [Kibdelosporangium aridum]SMC95223.1 DNA-binding response regulator, NarL/FixJ family, contains REC and HTH domains [Kibdelosporangium aridum]
MANNIDHRQVRPTGAVVTGRSTEGGLGIALVDSVPLVREGLSALVMRTRGLRWVGAAGSPHAALQLCERFRPHAVIIDSGLDPRWHLSRMLIGNDPDLGVLLMIRETQRNTQYIAGAIAAGVHGVISRRSEPPQLIQAIQRVHAERRYIDPTLAPALGSAKSKGGGPIPANQGQQPLSRREYQVLQLIADGLENQAIAKVLYVSVETVRTHVKSILRKLSARDRTHAVAVAFRSGVLTVNQEDHPY